MISWSWSSQQESERSTYRHLEYSIKSMAHSLFLDAAAVTTRPHARPSRKGSPTCQPLRCNSISTTEHGIGSDRTAWKIIPAVVRFCSHVVAAEISQT